jgi:membrane protein DedA with SNARE-associated domain
MGDWITDSITRMGVVGVFLLTLLETVFPPIPSELIMPLAGYLASRDEMSLWGAVLAGTLGSLAGALLLYWMGRKLGEERVMEFADRHGRWLTLSRDDLARASDWFARHGGVAVFACRLVPGLRSLISIPAGIHAMPMLPFVAFTAAGSLVWTAVLVYLGYLLGGNFEQVGEWVDPVSTGVIAGLFVWYVWRVIRHKGQANAAPS